jgi:hypothetical protein
MVRYGLVSLHWGSYCIENFLNISVREFMGHLNGEEILWKVSV